MMDWVLNRMQDPYLCLKKCNGDESGEVWRIDFVNPSFCAMVGHPMDKLLGHDPATAIPEIFAMLSLSYQQGVKLWTDTTNPSYRLELQEDEENLHLLWIRYTGNPLWKKGTDAETENGILRYRLLRTQQNGNIGDWYNNLQTGEEYWSDEVYRLMGLEVNAFSPSVERFNDFIHPEDVHRVKETNAKGLDGDEFEIEFRIIRPDGAVRWMHSIGKTEMGPDGKPAEEYGLMQDITDFKAFENQLVKAKEAAEKANQRKSVYLANMSHEIRIPLSGIAGMTDLLLKTSLNREQKELASYIRYSSDSLIQLINDVLDFSKIEAGKMELDLKAFDLQDMLRKLIRAFEFRAKSKGLELYLDIQEGLPVWIEADPIRLQQILNNLVGNAVKFTSTGSVQVTAKSIHEDGDSLELMLSVSDTGIGIAPEKQHRVFDDYEQGGLDVTAQFGGTGLGLAICKRLIEMMSGRISLVSTLGEGTTFTAVLKVRKVVEMEIPVLEADCAIETSQLEGMRILIAEDNFINRLFLTKLLEEVHQCWIMAADDGLKALELLKNDKFDCVLMDGHLPGMDGVEVVQQFRAYERQQGIHPNDPGYTQIIALTAEAMKGDEARFLAAGMNYYMTKPIQESVLINLLMKIAGDEDFQLKPRFQGSVPWELSRLHHVQQAAFQAFVRRMTEAEIVGLVRAALREYPSKIAEAETALWREDRDGFRKLVHALRGSLGYFGSDNLMSHMVDLENKAMTQDLNHLTLRYRELKHQLLLFVEDLKALERYYAYQAGEESQYPVM